MKIKCPTFQELEDYMCSLRVRDCEESNTFSIESIKSLREGPLSQVKILLHKLKAFDTWYWRKDTLEVASSSPVGIPTVSPLVTFIVQIKIKGEVLEFVLAISNAYVSHAIVRYPRSFSKELRQLVDEYIDYGYQHGAFMDRLESCVAVFSYTQDDPEFFTVANLKAALQKSKGLNKSVEHYVSKRNETEDLIDDVNNYLSSYENLPARKYVFAKELDTTVETKYLLAADDILVQWYGDEDWDFKTDGLPNYHDICDMIDAADDNVEKFIVCIAMGEEPEEYIAEYDPDFDPEYILRDGQEPEEDGEDYREF